MDVNLLPDELKKREEEELRRQAKRPIEMPMSTPVKELGAKDRTLSMPGAVSSPVTDKEPKLPHVREETYINVSKEGKIVHQTPPSLPSLPAPIPWWRRLFLLFSRARVRRVSPPPKITPLTPPSPPPAASVVELVDRAKQAPPETERPPGLVREKAGPPLPPPQSPAPSMPPEPAKAKIATTKIWTQRPSPAPVSRAASAHPPSAASPGMLKVTPSKPKGSERIAGGGAFGPPSLGINLLPPEWSWGLSLTLQFRRRVLIGLSILLVVSILGSVIGRQIYVSRQKKRMAELTDQLKNVQSEIDQYRLQENEWVKLKNRLDIISALLRRHVMVTPVFKYLEETVRPVVQYTKASFGGEGQVTVSGITVSYEDLAKQVLILEADSSRVTSVEIGTLNFDKTKHLLSFDLSITLSPEVWRYGAF